MSCPGLGLAHENMIKSRKNKSEWNNLQNIIIKRKEGVNNCIKYIPAWSHLVSLDGGPYFIKVIKKVSSG